MTWLMDERARQIPVRAQRPGTLTVANAEVSGFELPELLPVVGESAFGVPDTVVRAWLTSEPAADREATWRQLGRRFDRTGLWPLLVSNPSDRPFRSGELEPPGAVQPAHEVLRDCWAGCNPVRSDGTLLPHPSWPGLAAASGRGRPASRGVLVPRLPGGRRPGELLLVPADRPADTLAQLGWSGACNWSLSGGAIAGVLRSWEDRFGAYVVAIGFAELVVVVTRPPVTEDQCRVLAHEHFAFCPDNFFPQTWPEAEPVSIELYAQRLRTATTWHFWWD